MQDISEILIEARKKKGLELEQVARETNISRHYLEGLESDDYSVFPAEPYIVGFLKNYSDYLGLDSDEIIQIYKQIQVQETTVPPEMLLPKKKFPIKKLLIVLFSLIIIASIIFGLFYYLTHRSENKVAKKLIKKEKVEKVETKQEVLDKREVKVYTINEEKFEKRLFEGDSFKLTIQEKEYEFVVEKASPKLELKTVLGNQLISLGESLTLDITDDAIPDLEISVTDLDKTDPEKGVLVMINSSAEVAEKTPSPIENISLSTTASHKSLFEGGSAYPVTLNATFRGYCLFRYEIDRKERKERYYQKTEQITIQANNGFRIWASNGNAVKFQLVAGGKTVDLDVSRPGEVIVRDLKWIKDDETGRFKFVVIDVE